MTTYSIVVSGLLGTFDITAKTRAANWSRELSSSSSELELDCFNLTDYHVMDDVTLTVEGVVCYQGVVKQQTDTKSDTLKVSRLQCVDATDRLQRRIVAQVYESKTPKEILLDLIAKYAPWVGTSLITDTGGPVELILFSYDTLAAAIQKVADLSGAYWFLDAQKRLHFFTSHEGAAPYDFNSERSGTLQGSVLRSSFALEITAADLVNRVWIVGSKQAAATYIEQNWVGDGTNAIYSTAYSPNYPEVYEGGEEKTIEVDKGSGSDKDYTYQKTEKVLIRQAGVLPPNVPLRLRYRPTVQVIDYFEDSGSVQTYGLYEKAITDKKIADKMAARQRGRSELKKNKSIIKRPSWSSRNAWDVSPGMLAHIKVTSQEYEADCRIDRVSVQFTPQDIVAEIEAQEVFQT